jgi:carboxyl-terminal processing protease
MRLKRSSDYNQERAKSSITSGQSPLRGLGGRAGLIMLVVVLGAFAYRPVEKYFEIAKSLDIFSTLFKEVNTLYVDEVDPKKLIDTGIGEMLHTLDPYTNYIPEESTETFSIQTTGQYAGIGALVGPVNKKTVVRQTYLGFPANTGGIKVGDELLSVDGKDVRGKSSSEVSALLKGVPKSDVEVVVKRAGQDNITFKLKREKIKVSNVVVQEKIGDAGYIKMDDFTPNAAKEVEAAVQKLKKEGVKGIILDLRENLGGLLFEAVNIVNIFIPKGLEVVSMKGKVEDWNKTYRTLSQAVDTEIPLVILVGGNTASASEIVAGALQDYDRAVLVGTKTFGKGLVQTTRTLPYKSQLKITTAKYYIPSGRCIQAMDYTNRKADGTVSRKADSLKVAFKTKGGRTVYDGGGLDPDYKVNLQDIPILESLLTNDFFFEYANLFCAKNNPPTDLKMFKLSDKDYEDFLVWLSKSQFNYSTELEEQVNDLEKEASLSRDVEVVAAIKNLKDKILQAKAQDLVRYKLEITKALEEEIGFHYTQFPGRFQVSSDTDVEIQYAIKLLSDQATYKSFFDPNVKWR